MYNMTYPKLLDVKPLDNYELLLDYDNGEKRIYDVSRTFGSPFFDMLKSRMIFERFNIVNNTVEWVTGQDICPDALYETSDVIK